MNAKPTLQRIINEILYAEEMKNKNQSQQILNHTRRVQKGKIKFELNIRNKSRQKEIKMISLE